MDDVSKFFNRNSEIDELKQRSSRNEQKKLVCLNFKVPIQVRRQFKTYAASHGITMTGLLMHLLNDWLTHEAIDNKAVPENRNKEIKK